VRITAHAHSAAAAAAAIWGTYTTCDTISRAPHITSHHSMSWPFPVQLRWPCPSNDDVGSPRKKTRASPSLMWAFPRPGSNASISWTQDDVLLYTPKKNYTAFDVHELLTDLGQTTAETYAQSEHALTFFSHLDLPARFCSMNDMFVRFYERR
jgi:hypothetical protein